MDVPEKEREMEQERERRNKKRKQTRPSDISTQSAIQFRLKQGFAFVRIISPPIFIVRVPY